MFTRDLIARLRDGGMKSQALKYSAINEYEISKLLRPYGIKPASVRIGAEVKNGYAGIDFREALKRYVPKEDALARIEGLRRQAQLHTEAKAEIQKQMVLAQQEAILLNQVIARAPKDRVMSVEEAVSIVRELRSQSATKEANSQLFEQPTQK